MNDEKNLTNILDETSRELKEGMDSYSASVSREEIGRVFSVAQGIVWAKGLESIKSEELVVFPNEVLGVVFDFSSSGARSTLPRQPFTESE